MKRILIIGCPGSGKSTLAKRISKKLNYPLLHLDRIFHIDNYNQISREELISKILYFIKNNNNFIIDGNYSGTLELRMKYADTILFFNIKTDICLTNVISRIKDGKLRDDIAPGFDNSIYHQEFIDYVKNFNKDKLPHLKKLLSNFNGKIITFNNYIAVEEFITKL